MAADAGAVPVDFGPNVFRVETAAMFGMSVLAYEFGPARHKS
jgi:16S rRNA U1498 N3-methylase RsmE